MSTPPQSMNSKMPIEAYRNPIPARNARSTSSGVATPSSTSRTASFIRSTCRRGPMKPGESPQRTGVLPRLSSSASVRSTATGAVRGPGTTSTSGMMWAGFSQCATRNRSGCCTASPRWDGEIVDEPEAMMASGAAGPAPNRPAGGVEDDVAAVVARAGGHERPRLALLAEAELLVGDHLGDREAVVHLGEVDVPRPDAGHAVRRLARALER